MCAGLVPPLTAGGSSVMSNRAITMVTCSRHSAVTYVSDIRDRQHCQVSFLHSRTPWTSCNPNLLEGSLLQTDRCVVTLACACARTALGR